MHRIPSLAPETVSIPPFGAGAVLICFVRSHAAT